MSKLKFIFFVLLMGYMMPLVAQETAISKTLKAFVEQTLVPFGGHAPIVDAVMAQNTTANLTLQKIQETEKEWTTFPGMNQFMLDLLSNSCALELWNLQIKYPFIIEIFVADKQGALVAMTHKVDHYWQGEQDNFVQVHQKGSIYYGSIMEEKSGDDVTVLLSIPIKKAEAIVGILSLKINLDHWEGR